MFWKTSRLLTVNPCSTPDGQLVLFQTPNSIAPVFLLLAPSPSLGDFSRVLGLLDSCQTIPFVGRQLGSLPLLAQAQSIKLKAHATESDVPSLPVYHVFNTNLFLQLSTDFQRRVVEYAKQTGIDLATYPSAQTLQNCRSADNILDLFQDKAEQFRAHRDGNRKLIGCLKPVVQVLHSFSGFLAEAASLAPFPPANAILVGVDVLLATAIGVSSSYDALLDLFECVGNFLNRLRIYTEIPFSPSMSEIIVKIMVEVLSVLSLATKQMKQGRLKKFGKKLLGESEVEDILQRLDRLTLDEARMTGTQTLQVVHGLISNMKLIMDDGKTSMDDIRQALVTMQGMANEINRFKRDQLQKDIRSWLSPPDPSKNHNIALGAHHGGTAEWFTHCNTFEDWNTKGSLLWVHGKPGSGKSILCSTIIQEIKKKCDRGLAMMGYYYFDFKDVTKQDIRGLLTSILAQLCAKSDPYYQILSDLYSENNAGSQQPENHALIDCLKEMLRRPQQPMTYMILDALDECPNTSGFPTAREEILDFLEELVDLNLPNLRICVTSRPEIDIRTILEPLTSLRISLHDEIGQKKDILDYIRAVVHSDRKMRRWRPEDKQLVIDTLSAKADGMFRWVFCQLETLRRCFPTVIQRAMDELPETLDETYERTLLGIEKEKQAFAHRLFQCLAVAVRPLHIGELAEVLAIRFDSGQLPQYHADWRLEDGQEAVLSACSSLIAIVNVDGSPVVQFSHFSVKEFLTSDRLAYSTENLSRFHVVPHSAHSIVAQASLSVLLHLDDRVDKESIKDIPFARYAAEHWADHGRFENVSSGLQDAMERLFDQDQPSFATWVWIYDIDHPFQQHMFEARPAPPEAVPLYYATLCGFRALVEHLMAAHPENVNAGGGYYGTPVNAALVKGNVEIALLLLEHGADVNTSDKEGLTPLYRASESGRSDIVEFLLEHSANVDMRNIYDETALMTAAREGQFEVAQILLRHGASVDSLDDKGWTPLQAASQYGHPDIVQLLIQNGAAVESQNNGGWTPLILASRVGHYDIVRLLVQNGAAVDSRGGKGQTALGRASECGQLDIVRLLIQIGAAVDLPDQRGDTALMFASERGDLDISRELLNHGAVVNAQNTELSTSLHFASANGHLTIAELLIERHADVDKPNEYQQTPLDCATRNGELEIVRLLVRCGSNVNLQDSNGLTPLHTAAQNGQLDIVKLLIESGADVNARNGNDKTPLDLSSASRNHEVTKYLAEHLGITDSWADMDTTTSDERPQNLGPDNVLPIGGEEYTNTAGSTSVEGISLHTASEQGNLDVVRSLLDRGADVNGQDRHRFHETPLILASRNGGFEVAELLIKYGADVNCRSKEGRTPLHVVSTYGYPDVARLLLSHGADVNAKKQELLTPLHNASWNGHVDMVELLLERGADVHARDIQGRTPLVLASRRGDRNIVRLLSEYGDAGGVA